MGSFYAVVVVEVVNLVKNSSGKFKVNFFIVKLKTKLLFIIFFLELINNRNNNAFYLLKSYFLRVRISIVVSFEHSIPSF